MKTDVFPVTSPHSVVEKPRSPATERNRDAILDVLRRQLAGRCRVLEIGSGTGQHAVHFAAALPYLSWQTSDRRQNLRGIQYWLDDVGLLNTPDPLCLDVNEAPLLGHRYDAVFSANTLHVMHWAEVERMFALLPSVMTDDALLTIYGPFKHDGCFSNFDHARFDALLRLDDPGRGIRDFEMVDALARTAGLRLVDGRTMPAGHCCITWQRLRP